MVFFMKAIGLTGRKDYLVGLRKDADLLSEIGRRVGELDISAATFTAIGAVQNAEIAYYDQGVKEYVTQSLPDPMEMVSCTGNVAWKADSSEMVVHAHAVFGRRDGSLVGGHVVSATLFAGELHLVSAAERLVRRFDRETGLHLLSDAILPAE